jgi:hypothetical protein
MHVLMILPFTFHTVMVYRLEYKTLLDNSDETPCTQVCANFSALIVLACTIILLNYDFVMI